MVSSFQLKDVFLVTNTFRGMTKTAKNITVVQRLNCRCKLAYTHFRMSSRIMHTYILVMSSIGDIANLSTSILCDM